MTPGHPMAVMPHGFRPQGFHAEGRRFFPERRLETFESFTPLPVSLPPLTVTFPVAFEAGATHYRDGLAWVSRARTVSDYQSAIGHFAMAVNYFASLATSDPPYSFIYQQATEIQMEANAAASTTDVRVAAANANSAQFACGQAYGTIYKFLLGQEETATMYRSGQWIPTARYPATLVGLGSTPTAAHGRWWARSGPTVMTWTGLGDTASDFNAGEAAYNKATTEQSSATDAPGYQQAISDYLTAANDYLAVANDDNNTTAANAIQSSINAIQQAQSGAANTSDTTTAQAAASLAQANATTARSLAQAIASSNKAKPSNGPTTTPTGGGGGGGGGGTTQNPPTGLVTCPAGTPNAGQAVANLSLCGTATPTPAPVTTPTSSTNSWLPWAIAGGIVVGGGAIAYAMHKSKKIRPKKKKA